MYVYCISDIMRYKQTRTGGGGDWGLSIDNDIEFLVKFLQKGRKFEPPGPPGKSLGTALIINIFYIHTSGMNFGSGRSGAGFLFILGIH